MGLQYSPFSVALCLAGVMSLINAGLIWRRRNSPGAGIYLVMVLLLGVWAFSDAFSYASTDYHTKIFLGKTSYFGIATAPLLALLFAIDYDNQRHILTRQRVILLWIIPFITFCLAFTNEWHHLIWASICCESDPRARLIYDHGTWFFVYVIYGYLLNVATTVLLGSVMIRFSSIYRVQAFALIVSLVIPWASNIITLLFRPFAGLDLTPLGLAFSMTIWMWVLIYQRFLELVPVARHLLIERMTDGVLVLDNQDRVVDANPAARLLMGQSVVVGHDAKNIFPQWQELVFSASDSDSPQEIVLDNKVSSHYLDLRILSLRDQLTRFRGRLVLVQNVTERRQAEIALREANQQLQQQLQQIELLQSELQDQALRDPLTGLWNQRSLQHDLEQAVLRAERNELPLSVVMVDIDHFKEINDQYGHKAGDLMLKVFADALRRKMSVMARLYRYGGEEFVVLLPETTASEALKTVNLARLAIQSLRVRHQQDILQVTFSAGISAFPLYASSPDELLNTADKALYVAKKRGRNCVVVVDSPIRRKEPLLRLTN